MVLDMSGPCEHGVIDDRCVACELPAVVLHAPHLGRDLRHVLGHVPHAQILTGRQTTPGEAGCLASHQQAIRLAAARGWERVWVIEDDCLFVPGFDLAQWSTHVLDAFEIGFDTVFGGSVRTHGAQVVWTSDRGNALLRVDKLCSAHCVAHHARGYGAVLQCEQPYDLQLGDRGARCALVWPFVAVQRAGLSGIGRPLDQGDSTRYAGPQVVDYEGLFAAHERALRDALGLRGAA